MSSIDDLVAQLPMDKLAGQLGMSEEETAKAVRQALPALVGGMAANAQDPSGAASLQEALGQHLGDDPDGPLDLDRVDTADGEKIVGHVFGDNKDAVVNQLGGLGGGGGSMFSKLLPLLAPIVMGFLAKNVMGGGKGGDAGGEGGGGLGDLLGGLLGSGGGGGIGDLLGGLLGGGRK